MERLVSIGWLETYDIPQEGAVLAPQKGAPLLNGIEQNRTEEYGYCADPKKPGSAPAAPPDLSGLELYAADKRLCEKWDVFKAAALQAYPGVDLLAEVTKAHAWETANPTRRKRDRVRFLNQWLSRAQDQPRVGAQISSADVESARIRQEAREALSGHK